MPDQQRHAERPAGVPGRRLNPDVLKRPFPQDPAVGHAVERHAAGQAEILHPGQLLCEPGGLEHDLFGHFLDGGCEVHVALLYAVVRSPRVRSFSTCIQLSVSVSTS